MSSYGVLLDPGPGDTLRFLHGFCELLEEEKDIGTIFCTPSIHARIHGLLHVIDKKIEVVECEDFISINKQLTKLPKTKIWHCYDIKCIDKITKKLPGIITIDTNHEYYMIDRFDEHKYMRGKIINHLLLPVSSPKHRALLFLRQMNVRPERNMNREILKAIVDVSVKNDVIYDVVGDTSDEWIDMLNPILGDILYSNDYPEYLEQMEEYSRYQFAIGMNSGGLDLAIASGIPGIRIAEFHQYYSWLGANYNDFLSSACTVNISSISETDISNIGAPQLDAALSHILKSSNTGIIWL